MPRFELGVQAAQVRAFCVGQLPYCELPSFALGPSGSWHLKRFLALDASYLVTPSNGSEATNLYGGRISELLAGARIEAHARRYGFFIGAQPGYLRWASVIAGVTSTPTSFTLQFGSAMHFVSAVGPGVEYSPTSRIHIRGSLSDLVYHDTGSVWRNDFQPSVGVSYGLGGALRSRVEPDRGTPAPFLSSLNDVLITGSALAIAADAVTTQRFLSHGYQEGDPVARPLVKYGWSGQIAASSLELGAEVLVMYGLHRIGQHWFERLVPVGVAATHGVLAYNNARLGAMSR